MSTHQHHSPHDHGHVHLDDAHWEGLLAQTELEGELLVGFVTGTGERIRELRPAVRRILDIGSGPGVGTCELARTFPEAQVIALDGSPATLARVRERPKRKASASGSPLSTPSCRTGSTGSNRSTSSGRRWPSTTSATRWRCSVRCMASSSRPGSSPSPRSPSPCVSPDGLDVGRPGLAERLQAAGRTWFASMREGLEDAVPSDDVPSMLAAAGFEAVDSRTAHERFDAPLPDRARQVVLGHLRRNRTHLEQLIDAEDLAAIDVLVDEDDPRSVARRPDVFVHASRQIVIGRRV